jgi:hypothetical protein
LPAAARELLVANLAMLQTFEVVRKVLDARMSRDVLARVNPPLNPHAEPRLLLIAEIDAVITGCTILAWHCTRLLPHQRTVIQTSGLRRHSRGLFETRIAEGVAGGFLPSTVGDNLLANGQVAENGRDALLHFILNWQILAAESEVVYLLRNWGGEAIYNNASRRRDSSSFSIGTAAIVEAALPLIWLRLPWSVGEQMLSRFMLQMGSQPSIIGEPMPSCTGTCRDQWCVA